MTNEVSRTTPIMRFEVIGARMHLPRGLRDYNSLGSVHIAPAQRKRHPSMRVKGFKVEKRKMKECILYKAYIIRKVYIKRDEKYKRSQMIGYC